MRHEVLATPRPASSVTFGRTIRFSPFLRDLALTTATSVATIASLLILMRVLAARLEPQGFGAFMVSRRIVATLDPISTFAMAVALTRFAALAPSETARERVLVAGASLALAFGAGLCIIAISIPVAIASAVFGDPQYADLVTATGFMIAAYSVFIVLYAWYRGTDRMMLANAWQFWAIAIGPVAVAYLLAAPGREATVIAGMAGVLATAVVPLGGALIRACRRAPAFDGSVFRSMVSYAGPRVPGGLAFGGLLAVAPVMAPQVVSLVAAGYLAAAQALLRVVEGATEAFGRVALPRLAQLVASGDGAQLRDRVADIVAAVIHIGLYATCHLWLWTPELISGWLGPRYAGAVGTVRVVALGTLPYLLFVTLRSVLDAVEHRAVNATNLYIAIAITVTGVFALAPRFEAEGLACATSMGLTVLGVRTIIALRRRCAFPVEPLLLRHVTVLNVALLAVAGIARISMQPLGLAPLTIVVIVEAVLLSAYVSALWQLNARWIRELRRRVQVQS